jgi:hypothetical protein
MKTKHDIEQLKIIRDEYANDVGYASFAKMASSVNIVPRDVTEIAKAYAEHMLGQYANRAQALADALEKIRKSVPDQSGFAKICDTALQSWNQKEGV